MIKVTKKLFGLALLLTVWSGASNAQTYLDQQQRAAYAGAYFSLSFGGGEKAYKRPVQYGFSAGFRQSKFGGSSNYFGTQFNRRDANISMFEDRDWQARIVDLNFSDRGFERFSFSGTAFAQRDAFGQVQYFGGRNGLYADGDDEGKKGMGTVGKVLLWTGAAVGVAVLSLAIACNGECFEM